ncbi:MAG: bifunctional folylpolyglutamate synthase/dihydrofolate synthase [Epsilonproteobacteria bacterium]|nr:bifunctional folylpolyglutamate synthase/dihydrofolate synthase [Campylobacterota bacterium]
MKLLEEFLNSKPLFYKKFDPNRIKEAYLLIKDKIKKPTTIQVIGTNGKGSTSRALAYLLYKNKKRVGHFSSPHIFHFRERFWIDNRFATDDELNRAHQKLLALLGEEVAKELSYFEYQTLLALILFEDLDYIVLEAGLGGEFDATSVAKRDLTLFTNIGFDHKEFLGDSIEKIATSKLKAMSEVAAIGIQKYNIVYEIASKIAKEKGVKLFFLKDWDKKEIISQEIKTIMNNPPSFLIDNISLAILGAKILNESVDLSSLKDLKLFGRLFKISKNIYIDVGHNPLAAEEIVKNLDKEVVLIYNALEDKEIKRVLEILKPKIKRVEIIHNSFNFL